MRNSIFAALAALTLGAATPAAAVTFNLTGSTSQQGVPGATVFTSVTGNYKVSVTAWTATAGGVITPANLGAYGSGLGVTAPGTVASGGDGDGTINNLHTIDNKDTYDFIILNFDRTVLPGTAIFTPFTVSGSTDNDAAVSIVNYNMPYGTPLTPATITALFPVSGFSELNNNSTAARSVNPNGLTGNLMLVAADFINPGTIDGFKFSTLTVTAVPEASSWALMIVGLGLIGAGARQRRRRPTMMRSGAEPA